MTERALSRQTAEGLVETATAAPSMHNSQPWRFIVRLADRVIEIYADPARTLSNTDPHGRAVHIACGAALFNLRLAIARIGAEPVTRLLPQPRNPLLLASVRLAGPYRSRPAERELYEAIAHFGAGRLPGQRQSLPRQLLTDLAEAAATEGASLRVPSGTDIIRALRLAHASTADGIPQLAVMCTQSDDRSGWLRAGLAMQRVLLLAAHRGVRATPIAPVPDAADPAQQWDVALEGEYPVMLLRLGYTPQEAVPARRPVWQTLRVVAPPAAAGALAAYPPSRLKRPVVTAGTSRA